MKEDFSIGSIGMEQQNNTRFNRWIVYKNEKKTVSEWCRLLGLSRNAVYKRIKKGLPVEMVLA